MTNEKLLITINKSSNLVLESADASNPTLGPVPEGCMRMSGVFGLTNVRNNNQRFYITENYKQMVESLNGRLSEGVFGQLEHPNNMDMNWELVSHKVESITIDESTGVVSGTVLLLPTDKGKIVQTLVKNGLKLKISSRAKGMVAENGQVTLTHLETYDLVHRPGFSQARLNVLNESLDEKGQVVLETLEYDLKSDEAIAESKVDFDKAVLEAYEKFKAESGTAVVEGQFTKEQVEALIAEAVAKMQNHVKESMHKFAAATQNWAINEFAPGVQQWVEQVYEKEQRRFLTENFASAIQGWAINEFAPQIQSWIVTEFAPQVQGWAVNEFAPAIQNWNITQFAPQIQEWLEKEFVPKNAALKVVTEASTLPTAQPAAVNEGTDAKAKDECAKNEEAKPSVEEENEENAEAKPSVDESNLTLIQKIDLQLNEALEIKTQEDAVIVSENAILEDDKKWQENLIAQIPGSVRHLWEAADEKFHATTIAQAKLRNFVNEGQIARFWMTRFTTSTANTIVEAKKAGSTKLISINENVDHGSSQVISNGLVAFCKSLRA